MKGAAVAKGKSPWLASGKGVDSIKVDGSVFFRLSTRQESDTSNCGWHSPLQSSDGGLGDLLWGVLSLARLASSDHVGLEKGTLQVDVMVVQGLVDGSQDGLSDFLGSVQIVITIGKNLMK